MLLSCQNLCYQTDNKLILNDISFDIKQGENIALLGTNGAGKSTLLKLLLGILKRTQGDIFIQNKSLAQWSRKALAKEIAYVPQQHTPHFPYKVEEVVAQGILPYLHFFQKPTDSQQQSIELALQQMDILHLHQRAYTTLSGGERQRVLLARALVQQTPLILLDEPTNGLDYGSQIRLLALLKDISKTGRAVLTITHNPEHALMFCDRVIVLHDGKILADDYPSHVITADLIAKLFHLSTRQLDLPEGRFFTFRSLA